MFLCFEFKTCTRCLKKLEYKYFQRRNIKTGQLHEQCKFCKAQYRKHRIKTVPGFAERLRELSRKQTKEYHQNWRKKNRGLATSYTVKYKNSKIQRTPSWADLKAIELFYVNCPEGYEVDHIIPLQGKNVSGLHVVENLQYLTVKENRSKSNRFEGVNFEQHIK